MIERHGIPERIRMTSLQMPFPSVPGPAYLMSVNIVGVIVHDGLHHVLDDVIRGIPVIRVQHENVLAPGHAMSLVDGVVYAVIPAAHIGYPALSAKFLQKLHRAVRGRSVDDDMLHGAIGLTMHGLEILQQKVLPAVLQTVQRHGNDRNKRMTHDTTSPSTGSRRNPARA